MMSDHVVYDLECLVCRIKYGLVYTHIIVSIITSSRLGEVWPVILPFNVFAALEGTF